jgi:hypothetical protein
MTSPELGGRNATARVHIASRWCGGNVAARGVGTAAGHAGDRFSQRRVCERICATLAAFLKGVAETGYVDGRNVAIEYRAGRRAKTIGCRQWRPIWFIIRWLLLPRPLLRRRLQQKQRQRRYWRCSIREKSPAEAGQKFREECS